MRYANSSSLKSTIAVISSILIFACIAVCMIAAAPRSRVGTPLLTVAETNIRVSAPHNFGNESFDNTRVREVADIDVPEDTIVIISDTPVFSTPIVEATEAPAVEETAALETAVPETAVPETAAPETTAPETTAPETVAKETAAPEITVPTTSLSAAGSAQKLAEELGVSHTIVARDKQVTEEEIILTATVIQLEVMGNGSVLYRFEDVKEKYWEMLSVAQCIRNRADSPYFPGTPKEVILQSHTTSRGTVIYQFSPAEKLAQFTPTAEAITAAREVLVDGVTVLPSNYYYFCATRIEDSFEANNSYGLVKDANGVFDKIQGHLTTFYAGRS